MMGISFLLPALWLRDRLAIAYAETGFTLLLNSLRLFKLTRYVWWDIFGLGVEKIESLPSALYYFITGGLETLFRFSTVPRQYFFFSGILLFSSFAMYFLILELFQERKRASHWVALGGGLFYILNPFAMNYIWHRFVVSMFGLPALPLILLLTLKLLNKPCFIYAFSLASVISLFSIMAINPAFFVPLFVPMGCYILFELFCKKSLKGWKFIGVTAFLILVFNFWWLFPACLNLQSTVARVPWADSFENVRATSQWTPLFYVLRLVDWNTVRWYHVPYHPGWTEFLVPFLSGIALFFNRSNRKIIFFSLLWVIGLFLSKGIQPPAGDLFEWMFKHIPLFVLFRNPMEKFGLTVALSCSVLMSFGIYELWRRWACRWIKIGVLGMLWVVLLGINVWPMWTGDVFSLFQGIVPKDAQSIPTVKVEIPQYWKEAANFINQDKENNRVSFLPQSPADGMWYQWKHGYNGTDFGSVNLLFEKPVIQQGGPDLPAEDYRKMVFNTAFFSSPNSFIFFLGMMNVRYILVRGDVNEGVMGTPPLQKIREVLDSSPLIQKECSFGPLALYRVPDELFLPRFYALSEVAVAVGGKMDSLIPLSLASCIGRYRAITFFDHQNDKGILEDWNFNGVRGMIAVNQDFDGLLMELKRRNVNGALDLLRQSEIIYLFDQGEKFLTQDGTHELQSGKTERLQCQKGFYKIIGRFSLKEDSKNTFLRYDHRNNLSPSFLVWDGNPVEMNAEDMTLVSPGYYEFLLSHFRVEEGIHHFQWVKNKNLKWDWLLVLPEKRSSSPLPSVHSKKVNPTRYEVDIENARSPFWLVFNETFNSGWKAYIRKEEETNHLRLNGFANGWWVDVNPNSFYNRFQIVIEFIPQRWLEIGVWVSGGAFLICLMYLGLCFLRVRSLWKG